MAAFKYNPFTGTLDIVSEAGANTTKAITQVTHGFAVNDVVKFAGTTYQKAKADTVANAEVVGLVTAVADANNFTITTEGYVSGLTALTSDTIYFLSDVTAGLLTSTEPTAVGSVSKPLLKMVSTTVGYFFNWRGVVVPATTIYYQPGGTDVAVTDGGTGKSSWTQYLVPYADTTTSFSQIAIGSLGQVLTSNGAGSAPTFQAAGGSTPQYTYKPEIVVIAGVGVGAGGTGSRSYGTILVLTTGATANSYSRASFSTNESYMPVFTGNSNFSVNFYRRVTGTDNQFIIGPGLDGGWDNGTAFTFTKLHYGFKVVRAAGVDTISATNADATTETATGFTPGNILQDGYVWMAMKTGTTNIKYYENRTLRATHTTNLPAEASDVCNPFQVSVNNANTASNSAYGVANYTFNQDIY